MARKAVLEGGKRDELIDAAAELFFSKGYENTSVRDVLEKVGGEVGMFYHYFRSKEELFDAAVERFFRAYAADFRKTLEQADSLEELTDLLYPPYEKAMERFSRIKGHMHWTVAAAMHERTLVSLISPLQDFLVRKGYRLAYPPDIAAARIIADLSAALHSRSFSCMKEEDKKELLQKLLKDTVKGTES